MTYRDILGLGFMTLCLFVGAGNIIYPPMVGLQAGANVWITACGFLVTAVGLPIITVIILAGVGGEMSKLSAPIGKSASTLLAVVCYLSVGPLFAMPRTATVSFEIGIVPFLDSSAVPIVLFLFTFAYFAFALWVALYPTKLLDTVGNILSPLKLLALAILGIAAFLYPAGTFGSMTEKYQIAPFAQGFSDGYLTMDTLAALVFGIVIVDAIRSRNITSREQIIRYATIASIMALVGFILIYISLFKLGNSSFSLAPDAPNGAVILRSYVRHTFGIYGDVFLGVLITIACLVTAIGLTTACATYFSGLLKISYRWTALALVVWAFAFANLGLTRLIEISVFALTVIYPPCIVLILLNLVKPFFLKPSWVFSSVMFVALIFGILDALKSLELPWLSWYSQLPLAQSGLTWMLPALAVLCVVVIMERITGDKTV